MCWNLFLRMLLVDVTECQKICLIECGISVARSESTTEFAVCSPITYIWLAEILADSEVVACLRTICLTRQSCGGLSLMKCRIILYFLSRFTARIAWIEFCFILIGLKCYFQFLTPKSFVDKRSHFGEQNRFKHVDVSTMVCHMCK